MNVINKFKFVFPFFAAFFICACALPGRKRTPSAVPAVLPAPAAAEKKETAVKVSPEDIQKVEGLYYKAVGAYSSNDMVAALKYLNEISTLYPSYAPAAELRGKVKSVAGNK